MNRLIQQGVITIEEACESLLLHNVTDWIIRLEYKIKANPSTALPSLIQNLIACGQYFMGYNDRQATIEIFQPDGQEWHIQKTPDYIIELKRRYYEIIRKRVQSSLLIHPLMETKEFIVARDSLNHKPKDVTEIDLQNLAKILHILLGVTITAQDCLLKSANNIRQIMEHIKDNSPQKIMGNPLTLDPLNVYISGLDNILVQPEVVNTINIASFGSVINIGNNHGIEQQKGGNMKLTMNSVDSHGGHIQMGNVGGDGDTKNVGDKSPASKVNGVGQANAGSEKKPGLLTAAFGIFKKFFWK